MLPARTEPLSAKFSGERLLWSAFLTSSSWPIVRIEHQADKPPYNERVYICAEF